MEALLQELLTEIVIIVTGGGAGWKWGIPALRKFIAEESPARLEQSAVTSAQTQLSVQLAKIEENQKTMRGENYQQHAVNLRTLRNVQNEVGSLSEEVGELGKKVAHLEGWREGQREAG